MENQVRELLHERAEDIRLEPDIPRPVVRRARRRRLLNAAVAGTTALAVVAGAIVAIGMVLDTRGANRPAVSNSPTPTDESSPAPIVTRPDQVPAVWPETHLDGIRLAQRQADDGHSPWRTEAAATALFFAQSVLGWGPEENLSATMVATDELTGWVEMEVLWQDGDFLPRRVVLLMDQIVRDGPEGVWSVVEVYSEGLSVAAGPVSEGADGCPEGPLTRGLEASICVTLDGYPAGATIDAFIFQGDVVDIGAANQWEIGVERMDTPGGRYQDLLTEHLPPSASVLLVLVHDAEGAVLGAYTERAVSGGDALPWAGLWPQDTREEAEAVQDAADAGGEGYTWQLEVEGFLERFGAEELGWDAVSFDDSLDISDADESGPLTIFMTNCTPPETETFCTGDLAAQVTVERLLRRDRTGIWLVTGYEVQEVPHPSPTPAPDLQPQEGLPDQVADRRQAIHDAAVAGDHEALRELVNTEPLPGLEQGEGFAFSVGDVDDGRPVQDRAVEYWQTFRGPKGQNLLDVMAALLTMDYSVTTVEGYTIYSWPFLVGMSPEEIRGITDDQRAQLSRVYPEEHLDLIIETADQIPGYAGWRLGIDEEGRWIYFTSGE